MIPCHLFQKQYFVFPVYLFSDGTVIPEIVESAEPIDGYDAEENVLTNSNCEVGALKNYFLLPTGETGKGFVVDIKLSRPLRLIQLVNTRHNRKRYVCLFLFVANSTTCISC